MNQPSEEESRIKLCRTCGSLQTMHRRNANSPWYCLKCAQRGDWLYRTVGGCIFAALRLLLALAVMVAAATAFWWLSGIEWAAPAQQAPVPQSAGEKSSRTDTGARKESRRHNGRLL